MVDLRGAPLELSGSLVDTQKQPDTKKEEARLQGLSFVVKDSYDVAGYPTSNGNPTWLSAHAAATSTSPVVVSLLAAGARLIGKTVMDEMAYDLSGENVHYGTPVNPACGLIATTTQDLRGYRTCGGSSSGSAGAVAAGIADFAIGGDTGGSVRVPASFCGLYGMRPTHGRISLKGSCPLAPSFDTVGWFARNAKLLRSIGMTLFETDSTGSTENVTTKPLRNLLIVRDAFELADKGVGWTLENIVTEKLHGKGSGGSQLRIEQVRLNDILAQNGSEQIRYPDAWVATFRTHQAYEVWKEHGAWINSANPKMGDAILKRFQAASQVSRSDFEAAAEARSKIRGALQRVLTTKAAGWQSGDADDTVLVFPTAPGSAPIIRGEALGNVSGNDDFRTRVLSLTCISGLTGFPEISLPLATNTDGCPLGLSLLGPKGSDERLLSLACHISDLLCAEK